MNNPIQDSLKKLFLQWCGKAAETITPLPRSGSDRQYFRLSAGEQIAIGAYNQDTAENMAFLAFSKHFWQMGINVPQIYAEDLDNDVYLIRDLGDMQLLRHKTENQTGKIPSDQTILHYKNALDQLAFMHSKGSQGLDYSLCTPKKAFDKQSMLWDLSYFKYYFLKLSGLQFNEQDLEGDFHSLSDFLLEADSDFFLFRDFQARNILIHHNEPYFIDYQGGRKGARQYDIASLLFQAKAELPHDIRENLLEFYIDKAQKYSETDRGRFKSYYYGFVLIRCLQVLGAYGFRGLYEKKPHFISSIPYALDNLAWWLKNVKLPISLPTLLPLLEKLPETPKIKKIITPAKKSSNLTVTVSSFSYKRGIPTDPSGNGGGHVFDCRAIHNPGRYEPYKRITGRDEPVIQFLLNQSKMKDFLNNSYEMADRSVENYIERNFTHLMVSFGCTGGQHRSVYGADCMAKHLEQKYGVSIKLQHIEQEIKGWIN